MGGPEIHWYPTSHMGFLPNIPDALRREAFLDGLDQSGEFERRPKQRRAR